MEYIDKEVTMCKLLKDFQFEDFNHTKAYGFKGFYPIVQLEDNNYEDIPEEKGVYCIFYPLQLPNVFTLDVKYKRRKNNNAIVTQEILDNKWVHGAQVIYVGKAGGGGTRAHLRTRLRAYMRFGQGRVANHWGGRYIWHLQKVHECTVAYMITPENEQGGSESPRGYERKLLSLFKESYVRDDKGVLPFANLQS